MSVGEIESYVSHLPKLCSSLQQEDCELISLKIDTVV